MSERSRIVLGEEDFADAPTVPAERSAPVLPEPPLPSVVHRPPAQIGVGPGSPPANKGVGATLLDATGRALLIASGAGVFSGWALGEVTGTSEFLATSKSSADLHTAIWTGLVGLVFGGVLLAFERAAGGAWEAAASRFAKAAAPMFVSSFLAGYLAQVVYGQIVQGILEDALRSGSTPGNNDVRLYLARALGWALFGLGIGAMVGVLNRTRKLAVNGALGGVIGGTAGGLIFQFVGANLQLSGGASRLIGLAMIGGLIALATRAVETARREAWLHVLAGGMAGKEFILYHDLTRMGSSPDCEIFLLKDPAVAGMHATIEQHGTQRILSAVGGAVTVDGRPVVRHTLRSGEQLQVGGTLIGYSERGAAA